MTQEKRCAEVTVRRSATRVAYLDAALPAELVEVLWNRPQALVELGHVLHRKGKRRTMCLEWASQRFVLKHYREPNQLNALGRILRHSRAHATWVASHRLLEAGVPTPRPVACVENRWGPLRRDSFLMYRYVEGRTLRSYFAGEVEHADTESFRQQLSDLWQLLRQLRASLTDTQLRNFIVSPAGRVWVIDLDRTRFHRSSLVAAHYQERAWKRMLRSVATAERKAADTLHSLVAA